MTVRTVDVHHPEWPLIRDQLPKLALGVALATEVKTGIAPCPARIKSSLDLACQGQEDNFVLVTAGPFLVGYNIGQPWWGDVVALSEEFVVRYKPGNFADTIRELEQHARSLGCTALVISSLAMIRQESYGNYLKRKGFQEVSREYMKGL